MNIPPLNSSTFKKREREAGKAVEKVAKKSCKDYVAIERLTAVSTGSQADENNLISVQCSFDMGWQKRGKGHNSRTGHAAVMSLSNGKVLDYTTKNKTCRFSDKLHASYY